MGKKKLILCTMIAITVITIGIILIINLSKKSSDTTIYKTLPELDVISQHDEFILVKDSDNTELETFSIYKNTEHESYKKLFSLPDGYPIESRFICWANNMIYILNEAPASYNLDNGKMINSGDLNKMLNDTPGRIDKVIGIADNYIYYTFSYNSDNYYAKIDLELNNPSIISQNDIPTKILNK